MQSAIEWTNVTKRYGSSVLVDGISARMPHGAVIGLLGHNGAGKTTLIKLSLGLIAASSGHVRVLGQAPTGAGARQLRTRIGYLPENVSFYGSFTGREVIAYFAQLKGVAARDGKALLERVGLAHAAGRPVRTYSKGMRQRLGLAQALLGSPDLYFLDEPTTGLDPQATQDFFEIVNALRAQGKTIVISSHVLAELEPHLDRALIVREGRLIAHGTITEMHDAAGLPDMITARFADTDEVARQILLADLALACRRRGPNVLEFEIPPARKIEAMRRLVDTQGLSDITIKEPTLARLYTALGGVSRATGFAA